MHSFILKRDKNAIFSNRATIQYAVITIFQLNKVSLLIINTHIIYVNVEIIIILSKIIKTFFTVCSEGKECSNRQKKNCCKLIAVSQTNDSSFSLNSALYCSFNSYASRGKSSNRMFLNNSILTFLKYVTFLVPIEILHFLKYTRVSKPLQLVIQMNVIFGKHFLYSDFV